MQMGLTEAAFGESCSRMFLCVLFFHCKADLFGIEVGFKTVLPWPDCTVNMIFHEKNQEPFLLFYSSYLA